MISSFVFLWDSWEYGDRTLHLHLFIEVFYLAFLLLFACFILYSIKAVGGEMDRIWEQ